MACRLCGCTDDRACVNEQGVPCAWAQPGLCTACVQDADESSNEPAH